jgi:hypothetical protein
MRGQSPVHSVPQSVLRLPSLKPPFYRDKNKRLVKALTQKPFVSLRDRLVILGRQILTLTRMEYRLYSPLMEHAGRLCLGRFS